MSWSTLVRFIARRQSDACWWPGSVHIFCPRQNGRHFADDIFKCIFLNEDMWISINVSLKFAPNGQINNIPALVQIMAWRRPGAKPLSEPMMVRLPTYICVTRPQWVKWRDICIHTAVMAIPWWLHQMETFSALLAICSGNSPVTGEFPEQRSVTRSFDVFFDLRLNKRLSKQSWGWWFETLSRPLWRHRNGVYTMSVSQYYKTDNEQLQNK